MDALKEKIVNDLKNKVEENIGKNIGSSLRLELEDDFLVNDVMDHGQIQRNPSTQIKSNILEKLKEPLLEKPS